MDFRTRYQYNPKTDLIGRGGFATVYRATDTKWNRTVALKFFAPQDKNKYSPIKEISRVINLEHPNLIKFFDVEEVEINNVHGEQEKMKVGIMEYLDGSDIREYLGKHPEHRDKLLKEVLHGLAYLHNNEFKRIIHRDLKPSNVLIKHTAKGPVAKITDFGISKDVGTATTKSSDLLGTIEYMAPEQFTGGELSTNLDLWSWGCLAYELIMGVSLFGSREKGQPTEQILNNILKEDYDQKLDALPKPYQQAVQLCLVKDATKRAQRAEDIIEVLEGKRKEKNLSEETEIIDLGGVKVEAGKQPFKPPQHPLKPPVNPPPPPPPPTKKQKWILIAAIGAIALLVFLVWNQRGNGREDFEFTKTATGLEYKIFGGDGDSVIKYGNKVKLSESYYYEDSLMSFDSLPVKIHVDSFVLYPLLVQIFLKAKKGDSIVTRMPVDNLIKLGVKIPYAQKGKYFISKYKIWDIMSDSAISAEQTENLDSTSSNVKETETIPDIKAKPLVGSSKVNKSTTNVTVQDKGNNITNERIAVQRKRAVSTYEFVAEIISVDFNEVKFDILSSSSKATEANQQKTKAAAQQMNNILKRAKSLLNESYKSASIVRLQEINDELDALYDKTEKIYDEYAEIDY